MAAVGGIAENTGQCSGNATRSPARRSPRTSPIRWTGCTGSGAPTQTAKVLHQALGDRMVMRAADALPPGILGGGMMRAYGATGLPSPAPATFNAVISNVPGPPGCTPRARVVSTRSVRWSRAWRWTSPSSAMLAPRRRHRRQSQPRPGPVADRRRDAGGAGVPGRRRGGGGPRGVTSAQRGGGHHDPGEVRDEREHGEGVEDP